MRFLKLMYTLAFHVSTQAVIYMEKFNLSIHEATRGKHDGKEKKHGP
jgi:hypothetical protein